MATTRKKSTGFSDLVGVTDEVILSEESHEVSEPVHEVIEDKIEEPVAVPPKPFVEESIIPTDDLGPRFVEEAVSPEPEPVKALELKPRPIRHPRNVHKFSRTR